MPGIVERHVLERGDASSASVRLTRESGRKKVRIGKEKFGEIFGGIRLVRTITRRRKREREVEERVNQIADMINDFLGDDGFNKKRKLNK